MRADRMQSTINFTTQAFQITAKVRAQDLYTNRFLPD
jgi:hypothetical protein